MRRLPRNCFLGRSVSQCFFLVLVVTCGGRIQPLPFRLFSIAFLICFFPKDFGQFVPSIVFVDRLIAKRTQSDARGYLIVPWQVTK
jgi:hypothetical protein